MGRVLLLRTQEAGRGVGHLLSSACSEDTAVQQGAEAIDRLVDLVNRGEVLVEGADVLVLQLQVAFRATGGVQTRDADRGLFATSPRVTAACTFQFRPLETGFATRIDLSHQFAFHLGGHLN